MKTYILQTRDGQCLNKDLEWAFDADLNAIFRTPHRDIALNQLIELNAKDSDIRAAVVECAADSKGRPILAPEILALIKQAANSSSLASTTPDTELSTSEQSTSKQAGAEESDAA